jgi:UDP-glucose:(heptosyl)LPS alpha-1,3-glucosyltransferase
MDIAFCYESVLPARGGCETYITDLARRLMADGHQVHLYACRWDAAALPKGIVYHTVAQPRGPRSVRPWLFASACAQALDKAQHEITIGFDKTWGQDVLYPQGGLHSASAEHNLLKYRHRWMRSLARCVKQLDLAHRSFTQLERRQYLRPTPPLIVVNSRMVQRHFQEHYRIAPSALRVVHSAIDPGRFPAYERRSIRQEWRERWQIPSEEVVALFAAMNYRLKGLEPLLHALRFVPNDRPFCLMVAGNPRYRAYQRLARRLGVAHKVRFLGPCAEMRNCYFAADFLVHPTFYDPCSLVVLEALACGLPVITTRYNGASELLHPLRDGFVIDDPHDHRQLAGCIVELLDPQERSSCARAAAETATRWTFNDHYRQLLQVFAEAAERKRSFKKSEVA